METLKVGEKVKGIRGHHWPGVVVAIFDTLAGEQRIVVQCAVPFEFAEALRIYKPDQVRRDNSASERT